ncbi:hypothetical protein BN938_1714 [Mucinivorans hirudinis]|uniref:OmpA-like domain-containing protein n=1 Tax=Mucinivorans hirudinis TaxID=1433126 RepID=A0A060RDG8_9BACT|nr:hypothetical protein BN938_1714 [Mucinivorans hirudinis]
MKEKKETYFWASYSDLMTSLFFVMLVLFVLTIALLHKRMVIIEKERIATQSQLDKIREVEKATHNIDTAYFEYRPEYKKHILKIPVWFAVGSSNMNNNIDGTTRQKLKDAGESIVTFIDENSKDNIQYLLIIEGQASKDNYQLNYELSYQRALELKKFWEESGINFGDKCEVLISGSGDGKLSGTNFMREGSEKANQRFLIHIVPKYGTINNQ